MSLPFAAVAFMSRKGIPDARLIGKAINWFQGAAIPALILSIQYPNFVYISFPISIILGVIGPISAYYYIKDLQKL